MQFGDARSISFYFGMYVQGVCDGVSHILVPVPGTCGIKYHANIPPELL